MEFSIKNCLNKAFFFAIKPTWAAGCSSCRPLLWVRLHIEARCSWKLVSTPTLFKILFHATIFVIRWLDFGKNKWGLTTDFSNLPSNLNQSHNIVQAFAAFVWTVATFRGGPPIGIWCRRFACTYDDHLCAKRLIRIWQIKLFFQLGTLLWLVFSLVHTGG